MLRIVFLLAAGLTAVLAAAAALSAQQQMVLVDMRDFAFEPRDVVVVAGTAVRWVNRDDVPHSVVVENRRPGSSRGTIAPGGEHTFVFQEPGRYTYRCGVHPTMLGEIIVSGQ